MVFDSAMLRPAALTIKSMVQSASDPASLRINVVTHDPKVREARCLNQIAQSTKAELTFWDLNASNFDGLKAIGHISIAGFGRLLLPNVLEHLDRVLYLDSDLFVHRDVSELFYTELDQKPLAAVQDFLIPSFESRNYVAYSHSEIPDLSAPVLNSGVLLFDLQRWRKDKIAAETLEFCRRHIKELWLADQDALNVVLCEKWKMLPKHWNVQLHALFGPGGLREIPDEFAALVGDERCRNACIFHFTGHLKPWNSGPMHPTLRLWIDLCDRAERSSSARRSIRRTSEYAASFGRAVKRRYRRFRN